MAKGNERKRRKKLLFFFMSCFLGLVVGSMVVLAEEKVDRSIYEIGKFHIDTFSSYLVESDFSLGKLLFGANGTDFLKMITNMFFGFSKLIWQGLDFVIQKLYEGAAMDALIHKFFDFSASIYDKLFEPIGAGIVALYLVYIFCLRLFKGKHHAKTILFRFLFVLVFSIIWFGNGTNVPSKGEDVTKALDTLSTEVEGFIFSATSSVDELAKNGPGGIAVPTTQEESIKKIRELYYKAAVVDPYLLMNYGTTDLQELANAGIQPTEFLAAGASAKQLSEIESKLTKVAEEEGKKAAYRSFIQPTKAVYKAVIGFFTPVLNLSIGIPVATIGMIRFIFQLLVCCLLLAIPFSLIVSFFPGRDEMIFNTLRSFIGAIFQKSFYSVVILVAFLIYNTVDGLIPMATVFGFLGNMFVKAVLSFILVVKRKDLMKKLGLGAANQTMNTTKNIANRSLSQLKQAPGQLGANGQRLAIKGAGLAGTMYRATNPMANALMKGVQNFQSKRTPQEEKKAGQVINPLALEGRSKQALPYSGHNVRYHGMEPENAPTGSTGTSGLSTLSTGTRQSQMNRKQMNTRLIEGKMFVGQSFSLPSGKTPIPKLTANGALSKQIYQMKRQAQSGAYPTVQRFLNQPTPSFPQAPKLPEGRQIQKENRQPPLLFSDKNNEQKIQTPGRSPIIEAKQGIDFVLPKGRTPQMKQGKEG